MRANTHSDLDLISFFAVHKAIVRLMFGYSVACAHLMRCFDTIPAITAELYPDTHETFIKKLLSSVLQLCI